MREEKFKKRNKIKSMRNIIFCILFILVISINTRNIYAEGIVDSIQPVEYSEDFQKYLELTEEKKKETIAPQIVDIESSLNKGLANVYSVLGKETETFQKEYFHLIDVIPNAMVVKEQGDLSFCNAFATFAALESNLAIKYGDNGYDFSEKHMGYSFAKTFTNGEVNEWGFNTDIDGGASWGMSIKYLSSGRGPIEETELPYCLTEESFTSSDIYGKTTVAKVLDTLDLKATYPTDLTFSSMKQTVKQNIVQYGAVFAAIHTPTKLEDSCINLSNCSMCCPGGENHEGTNHHIAIVGWDDTYDVNNFPDGYKPQNPGAWIIKNSWGSEMPNNGFLYVSYEDYWILTNLHVITNSETGWNLEKIYEYDENGSFPTLGLTADKMMLQSIFNKQTTEIEYLTEVSFSVSSNVYATLCVNPTNSSTNISNFQIQNLKNGQRVLLTPGYHVLQLETPIQVSSDYVIGIIIESVDDSTILINGSFPNSMVDETFNFGTVNTQKCYLYNYEYEETVDVGQINSIIDSIPNFDLDIKAYTRSTLTEKTITGLEIKKLPTKTVYSAGETFDPTGLELYLVYSDNTKETLQLAQLTVETGLTSLPTTKTSVNVSYLNYTIQIPITVNPVVVEPSVTSIRIKTQPTQTVYTVGENFNPSGMEVVKVYTDGTEQAISDYTIENGNPITESLDVKVKYQTFEVVVPITKNPVGTKTVVGICVENALYTVYEEGDTFNDYHLLVQLEYNDGTYGEYVSGYEIVDGTNLVAGQQSVTIKYVYNGQELTTQIPITVTAKGAVEIVSLRLEELPRTTYTQGEDFDPTGMVIYGVYSDESEQILTDYTVENRINLQPEQTYLKIVYGELFIYIPITVDPVPTQEISGIEVEILEDNKIYYEYETFNKNDIVVRLIYPGDIVGETITNYTIADDLITYGQTSIEVKYNEVSAIVPIQVSPAKLTSLNINKQANTVEYVEGQSFQTTGLIVYGVYSDGYTAQMTQYTIENGENLTANQQNVTIKMGEVTLEYPITVTSATVIEFTNFSNCTIEMKLKENTSSDVLIEYIISNIQRKTSTSYKYYYYISTKDNETNIQDWIEITENQTSSKKIDFTSNSSDIPNFTELVNSNTAYLYIKEVGTVNEVSKSYLASPIQLLYSNLSLDNDGNKSPIGLPNTGVTNMLLMIFAICASFAIVCYVKYKKMD